MLYNLQLNFQATSSVLTDAEIISLIGEDKLNSIKQIDPKPLFGAYVVGQEGISNPNVLDGEVKPMIWMKSSITKMVQAIKAGTRLFFGHNKDNSTENRETYGNVVASCEKDVDGKNTAIIVCHIDPNKHEFVKKQDIISIEAITDVFENARDYIVDGVEKVKGFALGSSDVWSPGIPGARQLRMVQAMSVEQQPNEDDKENKNKPNEGKPMTITFEDVEKFVKERKVFPSQLFKAHEIFGAPIKLSDGKIHYQGGDRLFQEDANAFFQTQLIEHSAALVAEKEKVVKEKGEIETKYKSIYQKAAASEFIPALEKLAKDKKYPETALNLLKVKTKNLNIPEDEKARLELTNKILDEVAEEHVIVFGKAALEETTVPGGGVPNEAGVDDKEDFY